MYKNFKHFIDTLEKNDELIRIKEYVNPELEITEITDRISKLPFGGKAIFFENTGFDFPVVTNAFGSEKRISIALGCSNLIELQNRINNFILDVTKPKNSFLDKLNSLGSLKQLASILPKEVKAGECQQIIHKDPDLYKIPILKTWPLDGGNFITLPIVHTKDPITGIRNVGMYRMQVFEKNLTGMHWHKHKVGARHYSEYKKLNKKIPIAVALGGDPVYTYVATAPLPDNIDEYLLAGFLRNKPVKLVKCITQDIEVPEDVDFVIEGYVDPNEELIYEGPFGDHTGFYSLADYYPKFHVTCITHKKDAIYPATLVGIPPQEDAYFARATQKIFLPLLQKSIAPEIIDFDLPDSGVAHNFTIVKIKNQYEGMSLKIMNSLWGNGQMAFNKCLFITDNENINLTDYEQLAKDSLKNFEPQNDIYYSQGPMDVLDHASEKFTVGSKICFDFTKTKTNQQVIDNKKIDLNTLKIIFPNISQINSLLNLQIPVLILSIKKDKKIFTEAENLIENFDTSDYKIIIFVDEIFDTKDIFTISWLTGNNIAPMRDTKVFESFKFKNNLLIVDATTKSKEIDNFEREWPQIVVMDKETIEKIDKNWEKYNLGNLITSPSLKYID